MNVYQAPYAWVMSADYSHLQQLIDEMESLCRRGEDWDYERDPKGLVKFGFTSQLAESRFRSMLRRCEALASTPKGQPRRTTQ
jgi:hypothetical protein